MNKLLLGIGLILFIFLYFGIGEFLYGLLARDYYHDYLEELLFRFVWPFMLVVFIFLGAAFGLDYITKKPLEMFMDLGRKVRKIFKKERE